MLRSLYLDCFSLLSTQSVQLSYCFSLPSPYTLLPPFLSPSLKPSFPCPPHGHPLPSLLPPLPESLPSLSWPFLSLLAFPLPLQMEKLLLPAVDLEQWYQELMAGLGTGLAAASPRSSPPPLPAKASRQLQVTLSACLLQVLFLSARSTSCQSFRHNVYLGSWDQPSRARRILGAQRGQQGSFLGQPCCHASTLGSIWVPGGQD